MKYLCLIRAERMLEQLSPAEAAQHLADYAAFTRQVRDSGNLVDCNRLAPPATATTVRVRDGKVSTTDGPFAETKEQLGGYFLIEAIDLAAAVQIAARIPGAQLGSVELRPLASDAATLQAIGKGPAPAGGATHPDRE